jgi:hypothetical protein
MKERMETLDPAMQTYMQTKILRVSHELAGEATIF